MTQPCSFCSFGFLLSISVTEAPESIDVLLISLAPGVKQREGSTSLDG